MAIEERAKPSGIPKLQWPMAAGLCFEAVARELVRTYWDFHSGSDFKGCRQDLAVRIPVELKTIARFEPDIDRRHEILPGFEHAVRVRVAKIFVLKKLLADPAEWPG